MTMARERYYPDERVGPFPKPPARITDGEGRDLEVLPLEDSPEARDALTRMYLQFDPADRAQGIPPTGEDAIRKWLDPLVETGVNVAVQSASDGRAIVGHAVLVPDVDDEIPPVDGWTPGTGGSNTEADGERAREADDHSPNEDDATTAVDESSVAEDDATTAIDESPVAEDGWSQHETPGDYEWELAIFVLQSHQGAGVGTELLAHLLGEAAARGIEDVWLTVERWNGAAISLYERMGFERVGAERFDIEMALRLEPDR